MIFFLFGINQWGLNPEYQPLWKNWFPQITHIDYVFLDFRGSLSRSGRPRTPDRSFSLLICQLGVITVSAITCYISSQIAIAIITGLFGLGGGMHYKECPTTLCIFSSATCITQTTLDADCLLPSTLHIARIIRA